MIISGPMLFSFIAMRFQWLIEPIREAWSLPLLTVGTGVGVWLWVLCASTMQHGLRNGVAPPFAIAPFALYSHFVVGHSLSKLLGGTATAVLCLKCGAAFIGCTSSFLLASSIYSTSPLWINSVFLVFVAGFGIPLFLTLQYVVSRAQRERRESVDGVRPSLFSTGVPLPTRAAGTPSTLPKALSHKDGLPLVGKSVAVRQVLRDTADAEGFRVFVLRGPRGVGKSRLVSEAFIKDGEMLFRVHIGGAVSMSPSDAEGGVCTPFEPLRKAVGQLVGINRFSSASEQWQVLKSASDLADDISGLSVIMGMGMPPSEDDESNAVTQTVADVNILADAIGHTLAKYAQKLRKRGLRLVIVLEDMEVADQGTKDVLNSLIRRFSMSGRSNGVSGDAELPMLRLPSTPARSDSAMPTPAVANANALQDSPPVTLVLCERTDVGGASSSSSADGSNATGCKWLAGALSACPPDTAFVMDLEPLKERHIVGLLRSLKFHASFIQKHSQRVHSEAHGNPLWVGLVLQAVMGTYEGEANDTVRETEHLTWEAGVHGGGWAFREGVDWSNISLPNEIRTALARRLRKYDHAELELLQAAALLGVEFDGSVLCEVVNQPPLTVLRRLQRLEQRDEVVFDVRGEDDLFRFASGGYVDALLEMGSLANFAASRDAGGSGAELANTTQVQRQFHLQICDVLLKHVLGGSKTFEKVFQLADHSYYAGPKRRVIAFCSAIEASRMARNVSALHSAVEYCSRALELAQAMPKASRALINSQSPLFDCCLVDKHPDGSLHVTVRPARQASSAKSSSFREADDHDATAETKENTPPKSTRRSRRIQLQRSQSEENGGAGTQEPVSSRRSMRKKKSLLHSRKAADVVEQEPAIAGKKPQSDAESNSAQGRKAQGDEQHFQGLVQFLCELKAQMLLYLHPRNWKKSMDALNAAPAVTNELIVQKSIALGYGNELEASKELALPLLRDERASIMHRAQAAWAACFAYSRSINKDELREGVRVADDGLALISGESMSLAEQDIASKILSVKGGICYKHLARLDEAEQCFRTAEQYKRAVGDKFGLSIITGQLGRMLLQRVKEKRKDEVYEMTEDDRDSLRQALLLLKENDDLAQQMGNHFGLVLAPRSMGDVHDALGDEHTATEWYQTSLRRATTFNDVGGMLTALHSLLVVEMRRQDGAHREYIEQALALMREGANYDSLRRMRWFAGTFMSSCKQWIAMAKDVDAEESLQAIEQHAVDLWGG